MNGLHKKNFIDAVASRDRDSLNAEIEIGHNSTGWCNLANVAFRAGGAFDGKDARSIAPDSEVWNLLLEEMRGHLKPHGLTIHGRDIKMSPILHHNPKTELFEGDHSHSANHFLKRQYRKGYEVPEVQVFGEDVAIFLKDPDGMRIELTVYARKRSLTC